MCIRDRNANFPRTFLAFDIASYQAALAAYDGNPRPGGGAYSYAAAAPVWNPLQSYRVSEETWAGFVQANLSGERWSGNIGVRVVQTDTSAQAWDAEILEIIENGAFNYTAVYDDPSEITQENDYTYVLPSINFNYRITEDLRRAWARPRPWPVRRSRPWRRRTPPKAYPGASSPRSTAATLP